MLLMSKREGFKGRMSDIWGIKVVSLDKLRVASFVGIADAMRWLMVGDGIAISSR